LVEVVDGLGSRQISAVRGVGTLKPSTVWEGVVQWRRTRSPTRCAVRSLGISLRWRDGGRGGPGLAQAMRREARVVARMGAMSFGERDFFRTWREASIGNVVFSLAFRMDVWCTAARLGRDDVL
jgi:hypothetical protein